jgi:hypothetical protein
MEDEMIMLSAAQYANIELTPRNEILAGEKGNIWP